MPMVIRAFPLIRPVDEVREFAKELMDQQAETDSFFRQWGVVHESWHVQESPSGAHLLLGITLISDPKEAAPRYAKTSEEFDALFKAKILYLTGIDPNEMPLGPKTYEVFAWQDKSRLSSELSEQLAAPK
jgi:hypothetical protein